MVLSYDYRTLDESRAAALAVMTPDYGDEFAAIYDDVVAPNAPTTRTVVTATVLGAGVVDVAAERVEVLVLVDRPTTTKQSNEPVVFKDHATLTMALVDGAWLVDDVGTD